jgi:putative tryptophan/tyrosine transport system substrate-binding protein
MKKKVAFFTLSAWLFALCLSAHAEQSKKIPRIGFIINYDAATESVRMEAIRRALRELGYVEGRNIAFEFQQEDTTRDRSAEQAGALVRLKVELILVGGDLGIRAAMDATKTIPIIMTGRGSDPMKAGFIESLAHPGGNVTGLTSLNRELGGNRLELFKEAVPKLDRVAALYDSTLPGTTREIKEDFPAVARALGLTVQAWGIPDANSFEKVFAGVNKERPHGLYVSLAGTLMRAHEKRIAGYALKSRLPSIYDNPSAIDAGGLIYYGADIEDSYRRIAYYIDKILKGAKPADLPVEQPTKFEFIINHKTAKQIGVSIPSEVLARATKIIR